MNIKNLVLLTAAFGIGVKLQRFIFPVFVVLWWIITCKIILMFVDVIFSDAFLSGRILGFIASVIALAIWMLPQFWFAWMAHLGARGRVAPRDGIPGFLANPVGFTWRRLRKGPAAPTLRPHDEDPMI